MDPPEPFVFQQRHGKLDLRAISRVDVDRIMETTDIDTLQAHLSNITFCKLDAADLKRCAHGLVKVLHVPHVECVDVVVLTASYRAATRTTR